MFVRIEYEFVEKPLDHLRTVSIDYYPLLHTFFYVLVQYAEYIFLHQLQDWKRIKKNLTIYI